MVGHGLSRQVFSFFQITDVINRNLLVNGRSMQDMFSHVLRLGTILGQTSMVASIGFSH